MTFWLGLVLGGFFGLTAGVGLALVAAIDAAADEEAPFP